MKVYNNHIYTISLDSMRDQWIGGKPYVPDSVIERPEYSTNLLRELGCDSAQGYLVSPAIAPDELEAWVSAYLSRVPATRPG